MWTITSALAALLDYRAAELLDETGGERVNFAAHEHQCPCFQAFAAAISRRRIAAMDREWPIRGCSGRHVVRPGYRLTVAESTIKTPRFMEIAPDGTLYVSVSKTGQIQACRDRNGDGVYEEVVSYVEGHDPKNILQAVQWHEGWLWFAEVSAIYKARDTNGDGKADEIIKVIGEDQLPIVGGGHADGRC